MQWIQICSNEGPRPFPRGDYYEIAKIYLWDLKIFFSRTTGLISIKLGTIHLWVKGIQVCSNEEPFNSHKEDNGFFLLLINVVILRFELFSQVSDVAHWPLLWLYFRLCLTLRNKNGVRIISMLGYFTSTSGRWGSGSMWSLMTVSPPEMENLYMYSHVAKMSSGQLFWRKHMPSRFSFRNFQTWYILHQLITFEKWSSDSSLCYECNHKVDS